MEISEAKYKCGMYGGSFDPLHMGHIRCIIKAANLCKRLIIVISSGVNRDNINIRVRYRWLYQLTKHLPHVSLFILEDECKTKGEYDSSQWEQDSRRVKEFAGEPIDAVFCGSDYDENSFWNVCYPEAELIIFQRDEISSTKIRRDVYGSWDSLPNIVRPYYVKKVLVIGTESTGKSTLTQNLAMHYNTVFMEEAGRDISERSGTDTLMLPSDFTDILLTHKQREIELVKQANKVLFEDTDCLITKFFIDFLEGEDRERNTALAEAIALFNEYDLILFCEPDVKFVQDGDRSTEIANNRQKYSDRIKKIYHDHGFEFVTLSGSYEERYEKAVQLTDKLLEPK
ncbi:MAG: AAA family ATPase [Oscillospiraceae bacterium]|nr:AAA family ATPase [Oscillospiraceae bacterium]